MGKRTTKKRKEKKKKARRRGRRKRSRQILDGEEPVGMWEVRCSR